MAMHWSPMHMFLLTAEGCAVADFVGRQESFAEDLRTVLLHIGNQRLLAYFNTHGIPHVNTAKSHHLKSKELRDQPIESRQIASNLSVATKNILFERYQVDFEKFGFQKDVVPER